MVETAATYQKGQLYQLNIGDLNPDTNQPRKFMESQALEELTASVKTYGIIQPLLFRVAPDPTKNSELKTNNLEPPTQNSELKTNNSLFIVAGERRFEAAKAAGLNTIPAILVEGNTSEIALVENLLRQDLTSVEEAEALQRLKDEHTYTDEQLSGVIGKARTTISDIMLINRLPLEIRDECRGDQKIGKSVLIEIARKKQERAMTTAWNAYKAKQLKKLGDMMQSSPPISSKKDPNDPQALFDMLEKAITKLQSIDKTAWTEEAKANFQTTLASLKIEITNHQLL